MGIGEAIKEDYDEFRRVLTRIENTSEKEAELRKQLLPHFRRILYAHHVAEEGTLPSNAAAKRAAGHGTRSDRGAPGDDDPSQ